MERVPDASEIRSLIIVRPDRVGDVILSTSCLAPLREKFPHAKIFFAAAGAMRSLLENHPLLAGFIATDANLEKSFQQAGAQAIVHLHPDLDCYATAERVGIPTRIGYPLDENNNFLTHWMPDRRRKGERHEAEYNFDLLGILGLEKPKKLRANISLPEANLATLKEKLPWPLESERFVAIHPLAHSATLRWPMERFLQLADRLENEFGLIPVFVGAEEKSTPVIRHLNLIGKTDLAELGWLLRSARLLISGSSGPGHLAAAVGCPTVTLFGRTQPIYGPIRWSPLSDASIIVAKPIRKRFLESSRRYWLRGFAAITVDDVNNAVQTILAAPQPDTSVFLPPARP